MDVGQPVAAPPTPEVTCAADELEAAGLVEPDEPHPATRAALRRPTGIAVARTARMVCCLSGGERTLPRTLRAVPEKNLTSTNHARCSACDTCPHRSHRAALRNLGPITRQARQLRQQHIEPGHVAIEHLDHRRQHGPSITAVSFATRANWFRLLTNTGQHPARPLDVNAARQPPQRPHQQVTHAHTTQVPRFPCTCAIACTRAHSSSVGRITVRCGRRPSVRRRRNTPSRPAPAAYLGPGYSGW